MSKALPEVNASTLIETALPVVIESPVNEAIDADESEVAVVETAKVAQACLLVTPV